MKNIFLMFLVVILCESEASAQKIKASDVPPPVTKSFMDKFPGCTSAKWEKESASEFEVEFKLKGEEYSAKFEENGKWLETEMEMEKKDLPASVQSEIKNNFSSYSIEEAEKVETSDKGQLYEVEVKKGKVTLELIFDASGKLLEKKEEKSKEKKD